MFYSCSSSSSSDEQPAYARLRTLLSRSETRGRWLPENEGRCPLDAFSGKREPPLPGAFTACFLCSSLSSAGNETAQRGERETGLEPATACLEGRLPHDHRQLLMKWLHGRLSHRRMLCERAQQKCSHAYCYMTTCLYVPQTPAPHSHCLTKVFATSHRQIVRHWNCCWSNYRISPQKKQGRQVFS